MNVPSTSSPAASRTARSSQPPPKKRARKKNGHPAESEAQDARAQEFPELPASISDALSSAVAQLIAKMDEHFDKVATLQLELLEEQRDTADAVLGLTGGNVRKRVREGGNTLEEILSRLNEMSSLMQGSSSRPISSTPSLEHLPLASRPPQPRPQQYAPLPYPPPSHQPRVSHETPIHTLTPPPVPSCELPQSPSPHFVRPLPTFPDRGRPSTILQPAAYSPAPDDREDKMRTLYSTHGKKIDKMDFWWLPAASGAKKQKGEWIPFYIIPQFLSLGSVWQEWDQGREGCLAVKEIEGIWGTKWRPRTGSAMAKLGGEVGSTVTYFSWMKRLSGLVAELVEEMGWTEVRVIRFLETRVGKTARELVNGIAKKETGAAMRSEIFSAARSWNGIA